MKQGIAILVLVLTLPFVAVGFVVRCAATWVEIGGDFFEEWFDQE